MAAGIEDVARIEVLVDNFPDNDPCKVEASVARLAGKLGQAGLDVTRLRAEQLSVPLALTACNAVLESVALELNEYEPGRFALAARNPESLEPPYEESDTEDNGSAADDDALDGALLASWLLRIRGCIVVLELGVENIEGPLLSVLQTVLGECSSLKNVSLNGWDLTEDAAGEFTCGLACLSNVEKLVVSMCRVGEVAVENLARMLEESSSCVKSVHMAHGSCGAAGFASTIGALSHCRNVTSLIFHNWSINLDSAKLLAEFLRHTASLRELETPYSKDEACEEIIFDAVRSNVSVQKLVTADVYSGSRRLAYHVADVLKANGVLEVLSVTSSGIDCLGASSIADALRVNGTLRELDIHGHGIRSRGAVTIADALQTNKTLRKLTLECGRVNCVVVKAFAVVLKRNTSLVTVRLPDVSTNGWEEGNLRAVLASGSVCGRLSAAWNDVGLAQLAVDIESKFPKELHVNFDTNVGVKRLGDVFDAVQRSEQVTHLYIENAGDLPKSSIANLALALIHSKTLKTLELRSDYQYDLAHLVPLINALKLNESLTRVDFGDFYVAYYGREAEHLAEALRVNRTLHWLLFTTGALSDKELEVVAEGMSTNDVLLELTLGDSMSRSKGLFDIRDRLRRNRMMLNRAVEFVLGTGVDADESKEAFRKLYRKDSLVEATKTVVHLTDAEARERIEDAAASLVREIAAARAI
ncbi:hypothetical protein HPB47_016726 [Ixodes persulcatus]|uniref:Uncharacterized protein n=1 Tax=Ixodes persulcatus TaxID=34615 RepID=A0AC60QR46_IXOPE|nr:hypothetical protein HPB47_016726 [Ixodes persulcatus]